jgi:cyanophycinase-like exopeptidase
MGISRPLEEWTPGPLALLGSGEFLPVMADLDRRLLEGRPQRVIHLPTAAGLEGQRRIEYWSSLAASHFDSIGAAVETLPVLDRTGANDPGLAAIIDGAGMVFLSGGNPAHLVTSLRDTPVWTAVVEAWKKGTVVAGCSAGAMAMSAAVPAFRSSHSTGLGLVKGITVLPHFDRYGKMMKPMAQLRDRLLTVVGIDEVTALHGGPGSWTVHGPGAVHVFAPGGQVRYRAGELVPL